jgi:hypothetical protein
MILLAGLCLGAAACGPSGNKAVKAPPAGAGEPVADATINEFMRLQAEPSADVIWNSVKVVSNATGIHETRPSTPAEWKALEQSANTLIDMAGYIAQDGRDLVRPGVELEAGGTLDTAGIRAKIAAEHGAFVEKAKAFEAASRDVLAAIKARSPEKLMETGGPLDEACEGCHMQFYYPGA